MSWLSPITWGSKLLGMVAEKTSTARDLWNKGADAGSKVGDLAVGGKSPGAWWDPFPDRQPQDWLGRDRDSNLGAAAANAAIAADVTAGFIAAATGVVGHEVGKGVTSVFDDPAKPVRYDPQLADKMAGDARYKPLAPVTPQKPQMGTEWLPAATQDRFWDAEKQRYVSTPPMPREPVALVTPRAFVSTPPPTVPSVTSPTMPHSPTIPKVNVPMWTLPSIDTLKTTGKAAATTAAAGAKEHGALLAAAGLGVAAVGGAVAARKASTKKASTKKASTKKASTKKASTKKASTSSGAAARVRADTYRPPGTTKRRNHRGGAVKDTYQGMKVYIAKNGAPYVIPKTGPRAGRPRFIKR